ncbi:MAG: DinB family protein [Chloroflexota bacterium]
MTDFSNPIAVYLEVGDKRTLAGGLDWPGWCRGGRDEKAALQALVDYAPRYERALLGSGISFPTPTDASAFNVVERVKGNMTTDFGAPDVPPSADNDPIDVAELERLRALLTACWTALDNAAEAAHGKELRKGPRGGGRELAGVVGHVVRAQESYLRRLGGTLPSMADDDDPIVALDRQKPVILDALGAASRGEFPAAGPRGGSRWTPRYFVRRAAWHVLDHVWEIEDRVL